MSFIVWANMLSTGVTEQDNQHKRLIDLINQLNDAMKAGHGADITGKVLGELVNYTVMHFGFEEELMKQHHYSDIEAHKAEHARFVQTVSDFKQKFDAGGAVVTADIMEFLRDWLINHIMRTDKKLGQELNQAGVK